MPTLFPRILPVSIVLLPVLLVTACGLGTSDEDRLARAEAAFQSNEYRAAIIDAKSILQREPRNREARLLLGRSSIRVHDAATAEKELRRAVDLGADLRTVALDLGAALMSLRKFEQLLEDIQPELGQNDSERLAILRLRGDALMGMRRPDSARAVYREVVAADGADLAARLGVASSYVAEKKYADARRSLDETLAIDGEYIPARLASGSLSLAMRDLGVAGDEYARARELATAASDADAEISALIGIIESELAQNDLPAAKVALAQLQNLAPDNLASIYLGARIAFVEEDYEGAQTKLQQVLRMYPEFHPAQFLLAASHFRRGNLGQAEMHLSSVIAAEPDDVEARKLMAEIRLEQDRADEAIATLRPLLGSAGTDPGALRLAVRASLEAGEYGNAIGYLRDELENQPDNVDLELDLAAAYLAAGQVDEAEALLSSSPTESEESAYRRELLKVMSPLQRDDATTALRDAQEMAGRWPEDARVRNLIGGIALSTDNLDLARESFVAAQQLAPSDLSAYFNVARINIMQGDVDAAREQYRAALEQDPGSVAVVMALAQLEAMTDKPDVALEWLEKARAADSDNIQSAVMMATLKARQGEVDAAMKIARDLQSRHPDSGIPIALEAELLATAGQFAQAATVYDRALSLRKEDRQLAIRAFQVRSSAGLDNPEAPLANYLAIRPLDTELRLVVAESHKARGESGRAIDEYEQVLAAAPDNYVALNNLAWSYFEAGDSRAEELARRAYEQSPQDGSVADTLGWIQVKKGNLAEGIPMLRKAVEYGDHPEIRYHLAAGLAAAGDKAEARKILQLLLTGTDSFPSRREAEELLGSL